MIARLFYFIKEDLSLTCTRLKEDGYHPELYCEGSGVSSLVGQAALSPPIMYLGINLAAGCGHPALRKTTSVIASVSPPRAGSNL
jgi:hypothetical protein